MNTNGIISYYQNLLIIQYANKLKASATIGTLVTPVIMDQLPLQVQNAFKIGESIGVQLDILGKYAGVTRHGNNLQGNPITLNDLDFTSLIQVAIIRNMSGSSLATIQALLHMYFPNQLFVYDNADMQMSYLMTSGVGSQQLAALFITEGLLPKPMGVQLSSLIYINASEVFGMQNYNNSIVNFFGFNTYDDYNMSAHWLSYDDSINV